MERLRELAQLKVKSMNPKQAMDSFALLNAAWIQPSYGCLPLAWGFLFDARVRGGDTEGDIPQKLAIIWSCDFFFEQLSVLQLFKSNIFFPPPHVFESACQTYPSAVYFAHLGVGCLFFFPLHVPLKDHCESSFFFWEEFLLLVSDFSLWHCCAVWVISVVLRVSEVNSLL